MTTPGYFQRFELLFRAVRLQVLDSHNAAINGLTGTGFIREEEDGLFLYTCWHLVTGYDKHNVKVGLTRPDRAALQITLQNVEQRQEGVTAIGGNQVLTVPLYGHGKEPLWPLWSQDQQDIPQPDLNAINLRVPFWHDAVKLHLPSDLRISALQIIRPDQCYEHLAFPGDKVFVVGFHLVTAQPGWSSRRQLC